MFIAVLFIAAANSKLSKCSLTEKWINDDYIYA
jgi:hypothetical protein